MVMTTLYCERNLFIAMGKFALSHNLMRDELINNALVSLLEDKDNVSYFEHLKDDVPVKYEDEVRKRIFIADNLTDSITDLQKNIKSYYNISRCTVNSIVIVALQKYIKYKE